MSSLEREISQRELRNQISRVLQEVSGQGRRFVPRAEVERLLRRAPLDPGFTSDIQAVAGATIEEP